MKKLFLAGCLSLALARLASAQDDTYQNDGTVTTLTNIDAFNFINNGLFSMPVNGNLTNVLLSGIDYVLVSPTTSAYDFSDVTNYVNHGTMTSDLGFVFDTSPSSFGVSHMAASFLNDNVGTISSGSLTNLFSTNFLIYLNISPRLNISASNLVNTGTLDVGLNGVMSLAGKTVNLSYGTLNVEGFDTGFNIINGGAAVVGFQTGFLDVGIFENYWGVSRQTNVVTSGNFLLPPLSPAVNVTNVFGTATFQQLLFTGGSAFANTNQDFTNDVVTQVVIVQDTLGQVATDVRFEPSGGFTVPVVSWISFYTNVFTGQPASNTLFLSDVFGAATNFQLVTNAPLSPNPTVPPVPVNYSITRTFAGYNTLPPGNAVYNPALFNNGFGTNGDGTGSVTNDYSSLGVSVRQVTAQPDPTVPGQNVTNIGGRIEIQADNVLDLTGTILSGANYVRFTAPNHFAGSAGAQMLFPFADLNLRSSNGVLTITNILAPNVPRLLGPVEAYSARWTNIVPATNVTANTNGTFTTNRFGLTNRFHVLLVLSSLSTFAPAQVNSLTLRSTNGGGNVFISDIVDVMSNLVIDTQSLTITSNAPGAPTPTGQLNLEAPSMLWSQSLSTNLLNLTNFGIITAQNTVYFSKRLNPNFQSAGDGPYSNFVNHGSVSAGGGGDVIWSKYFENTGLGPNGIASITAGFGPISIQAGTALLTNGTLSALTGDIALAAGSVTVSNVTFQAGSVLNLTATNLLTDGVLAFNRYGLNVTNLPTNSISSNVWTAGAGLNLLVNPTNGDLLGTTITVTAPANPPENDIWAGADRGISPAGFANNAAVGHLILNGSSTSSVFHFKATGPGKTNALYVDLLDLRNGATNRVANVFTALNIDTNMTIYFADAVEGNLDISEKLDGANGGRLHWVSNYAGIYSSTNVTYPDGRIFAYNRPLRASLTVDSDGDTLVNGADSTPFPEPPPTPSSIGLTIATSNQSVVLSWQGQPFNTNTVYYRTLANTNWQVLTNFVSGPVYRLETVTDPTQTNRLYKVRIDPAH